MRRVRLQLIGVLLLVALLPLVPAAFTARALFERSMDPRLDAMVEEATRAGLASTRELLQREQAVFLDRLNSRARVDTLNARALAALDPRDRAALQEWQSRIDAGETRGSSGSPVVAPPQRLPLDGRELLVARVRTPAGREAWVTHPLPEAWAERAATLTESLRLREILKRDRDAVVRSLAATFLVVYGGLLLLVLLLGLLLARRFTRPLEALTGGIEGVAAGDLGTRVPIESGGQVGHLLRQFNQMVERLDSQQRELVRLEKLAAWRNLARRLAHEIKNPLTPIQLAVQAMRDSYRGEDPEYRRLVMEGTGIVEEEVAGLRNLVLEFSRFARFPELKLRAVPLVDLATDAASAYGEDRLEIEPPGPDLPTAAWCDPEEIHRVFLNLVNNALQAQENAGVDTPVRLSFRAAGDLLEIRIADRGPGVPAEARRRVFDPDYTTRSGGMGLGLAIVESAVRAHGGTIAVLDRSGGGAIFAFTLPTEAPGPGSIKAALDSNPLSQPGDPS